MADNIGNKRIWTLLAKNLSGEITQKEKVELEALMQEQPYISYVNEVLLHKWKDSFNYSQPDKNAILFQNHQQRLAAAIQKGENIPELPLQPERKARIKNIGRYAAAACIALAIFAAWKWWPADTRNDQSIVYQKQLVTQKGIRSQMILPDGSKVWLNAGSALDYPKQFTGKTRDVQLQGEAYFEVTKNREKPFFVHTKAFSIKVLGTGFNVRVYPGEDSAITALVHGSVEVVMGGKEKRTIVLQPNEKVTVPMSASEDVETNKMGNKQGISELLPEKMIVVKDTVQVETAWVRNKLAFKKMPLEDVVLMLENWFAVDIRFRNQDKKALHFSGVYNGEDLEYILYTLGEATGTFHYTKDSSGVIWIE